MARLWSEQEGRGSGEKTVSSEASRKQRTFQKFPSIAFHWSKWFDLHHSLTKEQDPVTGFCLCETTVGLWESPSKLQM